jgi:hypothetical protein
MFSFCIHCGSSIGQEQVEGQMLVCRSCGKQIGVVAAPKKVVIDGNEELLRRGVVARCALCGQMVEVRNKGAGPTFVPHYATTSPRKMCPNAGKPVPVAPPPAATTAPPRPATSKDLSAYATRERIRVVACRRGASPTIEELSLEYLDKADRVRIQIEALRDILGKSFQMGPYPATLNRPTLACWGNAASCVIAKKHERGGYLPMSEDEMQLVLDELRQRQALFFGK